MRQANLPLNSKKPLPSVTLLHGDCLEIMPTLPENSVQMVFADLPYAMTKCKWDLMIDLPQWWQEIQRIAMINAVIAATASQRFAVPLLISNLSAFRYDLIWQKSTPSGFLNCKNRPLRSHESILVFYKKQAAYNPQMVLAQKKQSPGQRFQQTRGAAYELAGNRKKAWQENGCRYPGSIVSIKSERRWESTHPTQKPVALLEWLIRTYTNEGDTVLDPTAGSGTTAIAAMRTGRHSICIEKDDHYFAVMQKRVADERARLENE